MLMAVRNTFAGILQCMGPWSPCMPAACTTMQGTHPCPTCSPQELLVPVNIRMVRMLVLAEYTTPALDVFIR